MAKLGVARGLSVAVMISACVLVFAAKVRAEIALAWQAPAGCPDAAAVEQTMRKWLESSGTPAGDADVHIDADVAAAPSGYVLALQLRTPSGARRTNMVSATCDVFAQLIALQASLLIADQPAEPMPRTAAEAAPTQALALRVHGALASSPLPWPAAGLGVGAAYVALPLRVELGLGYVFPRERRYDTQPEAGGSFQSGFVSLRPCAATRFGRVEVAGCVSAEVGILRGHGFGLSSARGTNRHWFALAAGPALNVHVAPAWSVWLGLDLLWSLVRPEFYVAELGPLYRTEKLGVRAALGIELRIE
jgi:hypothetical protein